MVKPCVNKVDQCLPCDDSPVANLTAEGVDLPRYLGIKIPAKDVPISGDDDGDDWEFNCTMVCWATGSQELADLCAEWQASNCNGTIGNDEMLGEATCADGSKVYFLVPADSYFDDTKGHANAKAKSVADGVAEANKVCCGLPATMCFASSFSADFVVAGGVAPYTYTVIAGALPTGVTISPDGVISGTLEATGVFTWTIRVTDSSGLGVYLDWVASLRVIGIANPYALTDAEPNVAYTEWLVMDGSDGPVYWTLLNGSLPSGLSLNYTTGLISGTPTESGTSSFTVRAIYTDGAFCDKAFQLEVNCTVCPCIWLSTPEDWSYPFCKPRVDGVWYSDAMCYPDWGFCEYWNDDRTRLLRRVHSAFPYTPLGWMHYKKEMGEAYINVRVSADTLSCISGQTYECEFVSWVLFKCGCLIERLTVPYNTPEYWPWYGDVVVYHPAEEGMIPETQASLCYTHDSPSPPVSCPNCWDSVQYLLDNHLYWPYEVVSGRGIEYMGKYKTIFTGAPGSFYWYRWPIYKVAWMTDPNDEPYGVYNVSGNRFEPGGALGPILNVCNYPIWDTQFEPVVVEQGVPPP